MTTADILGIVAYLVLPLIGIAVWRFDFVRSMPLAGRLSVATAAGSLIVAVTMALLSFAGIEWSRTVLLPLLALFVIGGIALIRRGIPTATPSAPPARPSRIALAGTAICWLLTLYGTISARESCGDLQFTWGPKAILFFRAGGLDGAILRNYPILTTDYPPLMMLLFAWSNTLSHQFSWWAAVLSSPLLLLATLAILRVWSGDDFGTLLVAATIAYTYAVSYPAGCAEPMLLLFETMAIAALTFLDDNPRAQTFFATLGVAGAVWTKLEGTTFAIATVLAILIVQRNLRRAVIVAIPAALLVGSWMAFVAQNEIFMMYRGAVLPVYWSALPIALKTLAKVARFQLFWLPWIVPIVLIAFGNIRRAFLPLVIALLTSGATVYFYIHYYDPVWWIESSSPRVILTPLLALLIGSMAARRDRLHV